MGKNISLYLDGKRLEWLQSMGKPSKVILGLVDEAMGRGPAESAVIRGSELLPKEPTGEESSVEAVAPKSGFVPLTHGLVKSILEDRPKKARKAEFTLDKDGRKLYCARCQRLNVLCCDECRTRNGIKF